MKQKYIFLDRDGVINKDGEFITEHGYITRWEDFQFLPGVLEGIKRLTEEGYKVIVISNQKCVGKGIMSEEELKSLTEEFSKAVEKSGGKIEKVYYCLHVDEDKCDCRKPEAGLFHKAQEEFNIDTFENKFFIGDSQRDMQAGQRVGLKTVLVLSGKSSRKDAEAWQYKPDHICETFRDVVDLVLKGA